MALHTLKEKQNLATNPEKSIWLFASAGSGKTTILVNRIIRLLLNNVPVNRILCITYTDNGTAEMYNRINRKLQEIALANNEEISKFILDITGKIPSQNKIIQARNLFYNINNCPDKINITTIHGFCKDLLSIFPFEANIRANFSIISDIEKSNLLSKIFDDFLISAASDPNLSNQANKIINNNNIKNIKEYIADITNKSRYLSVFFAKYSNELEIKNKIYQYFGIDIAKYPHIDIDNYPALRIMLYNFYVDILLNQQYQDKYINAQDIFLLDLQNPNIQFIAINLMRYIAKYRSSGSKKIIANIDSDFDMGVIFNQNDIDNIIFTQKKEIYGIKNNQLLIELLKEYEANKIIYEDVSNNITLLNFANLIIRCYENVKNANSMLDFADLINKSQELLESSEYKEWIKYKLNDLFDHILIDESQDTNRQQWAIINAISEDFFSGESSKNVAPTIFVVGDEKQSIFGFQGSQPDICKEIIEQLRQKNNNLETINFNISYRFNQVIANIIDEVFNFQQYGRHISKASGYQNHQSLIAREGRVVIYDIICKDNIADLAEFYLKIKGCNYSEGSSEINDFIANKNFENDQDEDILDNNQDEYFDEDGKIFSLFQIIASQIAYRVASKEKLPNSDKPINYGDFTIILYDKVNNNLLFRALQDQNIPFFSNSDVNGFLEIAIRDIIAILKFILLPSDDLNLVIMLKSAIFNLNEKNIFDICQHRNQVINSNKMLFDIDNQKQQKNISIYSMMATNPEYLSIYTKMQDIIDFANNSSFIEIIYFILYYDNFLQKMIDNYGYRQLNIIDEFVAIIINIATNFNSLQGLIYYLESGNKISLPIAKNSQNLVRISTIHSAKGSESPIVILINKDCPKFRNINWFDFDENHLPINIKRPARYFQDIELAKDSKIKYAIKNNQEKDFAERLRLLYVGMTRAIDELQIYGYSQQSKMKAGNLRSMEELHKVNLHHIITDSLKNKMIKGLERYNIDQLKEQIRNIMDCKIDFNGKKNNELAVNDIKESADIILADSNIDYQSYKKHIDFLLKDCRQEKFNNIGVENIEIYGLNAVVLGNIVHKILEISANLNFYQSNQIEEINRLSQEIIASEHYLEDDDRNKISNIISKFIRSTIFQEVFYPAKTILNEYFEFEFELEVAAEVEGRKIIRRIDLLRKSIVNDKTTKILIIDYKTNQSIDRQVESSYQKQILQYCQIMQKIYPDAIVEGAILWINRLQIDYQ
jgi:ATP-dependent helicase/nuclease subunit A